MDASLTLTRLLRTGWEVWDDAGVLRVRHETAQLTPTQRRYLTEHKAALRAALDDVLACEERAGIGEYCGGLTRAEAETQAQRAVGDVPAATPAGRT